MFFNEPAEDAEGVAEHKKEIDDFIGKGGHYEKFAQKDQWGDGGPHGGLHRWVGRNVLSFISHTDDVVVISRGFAIIDSVASKVGLIDGTPG